MIKEFNQLYFSLLLNLLAGLKSLDVKRIFDILIHYHEAKFFGDSVQIANLIHLHGSIREQRSAR